MAQGETTLPLEREISDFLGFCLDTDKSLVTVESYRQVLRAFARWLQEHHPEVVSIAEVDLAHVQQFRRHLRQETAARGREMALSTQSKYLSVLRSWLRYAQREAKLPTLNRDQVVLPRRQASPRRSALTEADIERLLMEPDGRKIWGLRDRAIMAVLLCTGLRVSQVCALDRRDVREDLLGRVPRLPVRPRNRALPDVELDQTSQRLLQEYLAARRDSYRPLFVRHKPGKSLAEDDPEHRLTRQMINRMLETYSRRVGLPELVSPSMLGRSAR